MTRPTGGPRNRRHGDVMELLARARPASLNPGQPGPRPAEVAARLASADRATAGHTGAGSVAARSRRRIPRAAVLTGTGLTAAAAAVTVLAVSAGGPAQPIVGIKGRTHAPVLLTAAMVHQVASASRSALAQSGRAVISATSTVNGVPGDSSTDVVTFSGKNWNDVIFQTSPGTGGRPGHTPTAINRIVNGQLYLYIAARTRRLQWYHDTNPSGHPSVNIPDPRTVLRALEPSARFEIVGYQVIDGVRVKELRATDLSHLPGQERLVGYFATGGHVTSLEVWVDAHGVVHRLSLTSEQIDKVWSLRAENVRHRPNGTLIFTVPNKAMAAQLKARLSRAHHAPRIIIRVARGSGAAHREVQVTTLTVTFSAIGQPQRIVAPAHSINQYGRG